MIKDGIKFNFCILAFPPQAEDNPGLVVLMRILNPLSNGLFLITSNLQAHRPNNDFKFTLYEIKHNVRSSTLPSKLFNFIAFNFESSYYLYKKKNTYELVIFYISTAVILPMIISKLLRKKTILILSGSASKSVKSTYGETFTGSFIFLLALALEYINLQFSDLAINYSPLTKRYHNSTRCLFAGAPFVDTNIFTISKPFDQRANNIAFIGRLAEEKGVLNFAKALPELLKLINDLHIFIIGQGPLYDYLFEHLNSNGLLGQVTLLGWVDHDSLPYYLNKFRLIVLPSYTEGLPHILLEAMSCGTPVVATAVGNIPDVIINGKNGFLLPDNSVENIIKCLYIVLMNNNLGIISDNAKETIQETFTFESAVERYKNILANL